MSTLPTVVISLDLELSWGSFDHSYSQGLLDMARWTHDIGVPTLLGHLTRNGLSASWAVVGAMMLDRLPDVSGLPEVSYPHFDKPWFAYVPRDGDEARYPEWFGASLVELIRHATPRQEIRFHSFSHVIFGDAGTPAGRALAEFCRCTQIAREKGFAPDSFVFPRNSVKYTGELRDAGFICFRDVDNVPFRDKNRKVMSVWAVLQDFLGAAPRMITPSVQNGAVAIPGSLMLRYAGGWRKYIPDAMRLQRLRRGLALARRTNGIFHVWFHPENMYAERPRIENVVATFCQELGKLVASGEVRCLTMGELAREVLSS